jgi:ABC-type phosphate transport system ATPase subunit
MDEPTSTLDLFRHPKVENLFELRTNTIVIVTLQYATKLVINDDNTAFFYG